MWIPVAVGLAAAVTTAGCSPQLRCFGAKSDERYNECVSAEEDSDRAEKAARKEEERRRKEYREAIEPCGKGDPLACLTVATWGAGHDGEPASVIAAYQVACDGSLAGGCVSGGVYAGAHQDVTRAITLYERACDLRDSRGCVGAAAFDAGRAMELETRACELRDYAACYRVGQGHLAAHRRAEAEQFLQQACRGGEKEACHQLGRLDIEEAP